MRFTRNTIMATLLLTAIMFVFASGASAHTPPHGTCWRQAQTQPDGEKYPFLIKCRKFVAAHARKHRQEALARKCAATSVAATYDVCLGLVESPMPKWWVTDADFHELIRRESDWNPRAVNSSSGACGLGQFLPCRCFSKVRVQGRCIADYIHGRYGSPARALAHHNVTGWY